MDTTTSLPLLAGALATLLFTTSHIPMLVRAYTTKDLRSYSRTQLVLSNVGNGVYWIYVTTLPLGPIWLLHTFYTLATALMLVWYLRYRAAPINTAPRRNAEGTKVRPHERCPDGA